MDLEKELEDLEARFKSIFMESPIAITLYDSDGKLLDANKACLDMINVSDVADIRGFDILDDPNMPRDVKERLKKGETVRFEFLYDFDKVKDSLRAEISGVLYFDAIISPIYLSNREYLTYYLVQVQDNTERRKAGKALRESEYKYRSLFDNMNAGLAYHEIILDENNKPIDYRFLEANPAFERFTGLKVDEILGRTVTEVLPEIENDPADWIGKYGNVALTGAPFSFEDYSEQIKKWYNVSSYSPKKGYFAVTFTDITELKRVQQVLKESEEKLKKSNIELEKKVEDRTKELKESETKYRALFEQAGDSIILIDTEIGDIVDFNDKMHENLGYTRDEFKNLKIPDFDVMESTEDYRAHIEKVIREGSDTFETKYLTKNSEVRNMMVSARAIKINDKNYLHSIIRDITERKVLEEQIQESEVKFRTIFEAIPDLFLLVSADGTYLDYKGKGEDFYIPPEEFIGKKIDDVIPKDLANRFKLCIEKTIETQQPQIIEYSLPIKGHSHHFECRFLFFNKNQVAAFIRDINDRKLAEVNLTEAYSQANLYKDLFAHDINNLLQNILSASELCTLFLDKQEKHYQLSKSLAIINDQVRRGSNLISNVRKLSELEETSMQIQAVEICEILKNSINFIKKSFQNREINIQVDSFRKRILVKANELIIDVFENILFNAIRHNRNSNVEISVKLSKEQRNGINLTKIEFKDNGVGISSDRKKSIFQEGSKRIKHGKGMGLGLSLVKKIVDKYNGEVWVEDRVKGDSSKGSNFIILIPEAN